MEAHVAESAPAASVGSGGGGTQAGYTGPGLLDLAASALDPEIELEAG